MAKHEWCDVISIIAAMANNRVIGKDGELPWHLPADLQHFKALTMGKPVIMGRKTFESIGKALPGRDNIVLTHDPSFRSQGIRVVYSWDEAIEACDDADEIMVIGGAQLYAQILDQADWLYLTLIDLDIDGDTYFPDWSTAEWQEVERIERPADAENLYAMTFLTLLRQVD